MYATCVISSVTSKEGEGKMWFFLFLFGDETRWSTGAKKSSGTFSEKQTGDLVHLKEKLNPGVKKT